MRKDTPDLRRRYAAMPLEQFLEGLARLLHVTAHERTVRR
jgi:hypothetical protein